MSIRERMYELTDIEQVDEFLKEHPTGAFFKAGACHKTMQGFGYVEEALNGRENIHMGFVRVIEDRPVSNYITEITGVVHQSPQLILLKEGEVVFDVDNWDITPEVLESALAHQFGATSTEVTATHDGDVTPYLSLLQDYIEGNLSEDAFTHQWLITFQSDATPRSTAQFNVLNGLFGDVDAAIASGPLAVATAVSLKDRAEKLHKSLTDK